MYTMKFKRVKSARNGIDLMMQDVPASSPSGFVLWSLHAAVTGNHSVQKRTEEFAFKVQATTVS